jgi:DNA-binding LytR/AlgR family response regulator
MTKINCIAVDDEPFALEIMAEEIKKLGYLDLKQTFSNTKEADIFLQENAIDLIFLDIQMPTQTGIQFLESLENPPMVIFTTAFQKYALTGFDLKVIDYLLKPTPFERFKQATDRAFELFKLRQDQSEKPQERESFFVFVEYKKTKIYQDEILYIEGLKDYVKIFLKGSPSKPILTRMNLRNINKILSEPLFCRVHNSFIVAINYITFIQKSKLKILEKEIPIGNHYLEAFEKKMMM